MKYFYIILSILIIGFTLGFFTQLNALILVPYTVATTYIYNNVREHYYNK